jgi:hypothetical protein
LSGKVLNRRKSQFSTGENSIVFMVLSEQTDTVHNNVGNNVELYLRENNMRETNNTVDFKFLISATWIDIMRAGSNEDTLDDKQWWEQHNKEINFAFRVLSGLGLAKSTVLPQDENELESAVQEFGADEGGLESFRWDVVPSRELISLYQKAVRRYLRERDIRLSPWRT